MSANPQPLDTRGRRRPTFFDRVDRFWQRVTEGLALSDLWTQFRTDARTGYRLYSKDIDATRGAGVPRGRHFFNVVGQFFWAVLEKLSPARRVLLLVALVLVVFPAGGVSWSGEAGRTSFTVDFHFWGGLLMFALLILEVGDRVVMKRDLQIAKEIQSWLLPAQPPPVPGMEIAFATRPANTVAGDYYDVFARPCSSAQEGSFLLAVADVAGKSVPAAMLMATFQASLKTLCNTPGRLTELLTQMNRYACSNSQNGRRFTTAFIGEYVPATRTLTYVNAGHNNPILRRKTGAIERLAIGGVPLGILEDAAYESATVTLEPGDWLVVFTDGVIEAENNAQQEYGEERLLVMLHSGVALAPAMLLNSIMADLDRFTGDAPQHDDVTCMLLKTV
jgi:sigma-B regulation protein RsbU (phosphoserine phosphatase)